MSLQLRKLTLQTIPELEPRVALLFEKLCRLIAEDCMDRPTEKKARKVVLQITCVPVVRTLREKGDLPECDLVRCQISAKHTIPTHSSTELDLDVNSAGFRFNADFPDAIDQRPLPFTRDADGE